MMKKHNLDLKRPVVQKLLTIAAVLIFVNLLDSIWLTYEFFAQSENSVCSINAVFDCITVAQSDYAVLFGIPVAVLGVFFYLGLLIGTIGAKYGWPFKKEVVFTLTKYFVYFGVLFSFYLTFIEAFVIKVYCPFCILQQILILIVAALYIWAHRVAK